MWLEIFRTGTHTDSSGQVTSYNAQDLSEMAQLYNNRVMSDSRNEAPLVKGHPKDDSPAYGWIERLARRGDKLVAKVRYVTPDLLEELSSGRYRNVSIALYPDKMLRHVGLLGAVAPAIKGLDILSFSENDYCNYESKLTIIDEKDNEVISSNFSEKEFEAISLENKSLREKLGTMEAEMNDLKKKIIDLNKQKRENEIKEFAETALKSINGSMFSAYQSAELRALLEEATEAEEVLNEQDTSKEYSLSERIKSFVLSLKPNLLGKEIATKQESGEQSSQFSIRNTIPERLRLHELAKEIQLENPSLSYEEAVILANKTNIPY